jgi:hypothetical protein
MVFKCRIRLIWLRGAWAAKIGFREGFLEGSYRQNEGNTLAFCRDDLKEGLFVAKNAFRRLVNAFCPLVNAFRSLVDAFRCLVNAFRLIVNAFRRLVNTFCRLVNAFRCLVNGFH